MAGESEEETSLASRLVRLIPSSQFSPFWPVVVGVPASLIVWLVSGSQSWLGASLIGLCALACVWEALVLAAQNLARGRPSPELISEHRWLRGRTFAWAILLIALSGLVLVTSRLNNTVATTLVPGNDFAVTEVVVLGLTIGILALLTRYTAISSYVESSRLASNLKTAVEGVNTSVGELKESIRALSVEVARLRSAQMPLPRVEASVLYLTPQKKSHVFNWRIAVSEAKATAIALIVSVNSRPGTPLAIGDLAPGGVKEGPIASVDSLADSGAIGLTVSYADPAGGYHTQVANFGYSKEKGLLGGIKNVRLARV